MVSSICSFHLQLRSWLSNQPLWLSTQCNGRCFPRNRPGCIYRGLVDWCNKEGVSLLIYGHYYSFVLSTTSPFAE